MAVANIQDTTNFKKLKAIEIDYTSAFEKQLQDFQAALSISRVLPVSEGMTLKMYTGYDVTLADGNVAEGELIPLSKATPKEAVTKEITLKKYRKQTTAEAIQKYGMIPAINQTDEAIIKEVQKAVRQDMFTAIKSGTTEKTNLSSGTLQGALATAWGGLQELFEDDAIQTVAFVHPMDAATHIAKGELSTQTAFGMSYLTGFTSTVVIVSTLVEQGKIYATVPQNLIFAYVEASGAAGQALGLTTAQEAYIGMKHFVEETTATHQTLLMSGIVIYPERLDGIVKVTITSA